MIMPLAIMAIAPDRKRLMTLVDLWAGSALVNAGAALTDAIHITHFTGYLFGVGPVSIGRQAGLTNHPNHLATVLVMAIPIVLSWWQRAGVWRRRSVIALTILVIALISTGSRGGLAAGGVIIVIGVLTQPAVRKAVQPALLPLGLVVAALLLIDQHLTQSLLHHTRFGASGAGSDHQRAEVGRQAVMDFKHRPWFGIGFDVADQGHSIYLQMLATGGVLTLVAMALYVSGVVRSVVSRVWDDWTPTVIGCLVSLLGWLTLGVVDNDFADRYPYVPMAMMLAIAAARMRTSTTARGSADVPLPPALVAANSSGTMPVRRHQVRSHRGESRPASGAGLGLPRPGYRGRR